MWGQFCARKKFILGLVINYSSKSEFALRFLAFHMQVLRFPLLISADTCIDPLLQKWCNNAVPSRPS